MEIRFNVTGARRKELVKVIADMTDTKAKYLGMPSAAYEIDSFMVTKDGTLMFSDRIDGEAANRVLEAIADAGFEAEAQEAEAAVIPEEPKEDAEEATKGGQGETVELTVAIPLDKVNVGNLTKLLDAKGSLIQKAIGITSLQIEIREDRVEFPWFTEVEPDEAMAYTHFISALCEMSRNAKRVTATEKKVENEKYAFRCFLLRLGFIGPEYKKDRKILLRNLTGSSAFRNGGAGHEVSE